MSGWPGFSRSMTSLWVGELKCSGSKNPSLTGWPPRVHTDEGALQGVCQECSGKPSRALGRWAEGRRRADPAGGGGQAQGNTEPWRHACHGVVLYRGHVLAVYPPCPPVTGDSSQGQPAPGPGDRPPLGAVGPGSGSDPRSQCARDGTGTDLGCGRQPHSMQRGRG